MATIAEVEFAYRLMLGREPENQETVKALAKRHPTLKDLRHTFVTSTEFEMRYFAERDAMAITPSRPLNWQPGTIQTAVSAEALQRLIARVEREFTHLGETEPHWSVLAAEKFKAENIAAHEDEFFASGKGVVDDLAGAARRNGVDLPTSGVCFELGCGLGRTTIWLADAFDRVIAADISPAHLLLAREAASRFGKTNIDFQHVNSPRAFEHALEFDVFFSLIVLQHNPPPLIVYMLRHMLRKLRPNGIAYFQIPTCAPGYKFSLNEYLAQEQERDIPEMHVLPQLQLFRLIDEEGGELIEIREDDWAGPNYVSNRVLVRKKAAEQSR